MSTTYSEARPLNRTPSPQRGGTRIGAPASIDIGLLALRVTLGLLLAGHGSQKLFGWFGGGGLDGTGAFFASLGYTPGTFFAAIAGASELLGGIGLVLGLLTPLAAAAVIGTMVNAIAVTSPNGVWDADGGYELPLVVAVSAAALALAGPGRLALDRFVLRVGGVRLGGAAIAVGLVTGLGVRLL